MLSWILIASAIQSTSFAEEPCEDCEVEIEIRIRGKKPLKTYPSVTVHFPEEESTEDNASPSPVLPPTPPINPEDTPEIPPPESPTESSIAPETPIAPPTPAPAPPTPAPNAPAPVPGPTPTACDAHRDWRSFLSNDCFHSAAATGGNCVANVVYGTAKSVTDLTQFVWKAGSWTASKVAGTLHSDTGKWIEKTSKDTEERINAWWDMSAQVETTTSAALKTVSALPSESDFKKLEENSPGVLNRMTSATYDFVAESVTNTFGCEKWKDGDIPYWKGSKCEVGWKGLSCASCEATVGVACGTMGYILGEIPSSFLFGRIFRAVEDGGEFAIDLSRKTASQIEDLFKGGSKAAPKSAKQESAVSGIFSKAFDLVKRAVAWTDNVKLSIGRLAENLRNKIYSIHASYLSSAAKIKNPVLCGLERLLYRSTMAIKHWSIDPVLSGIQKYFDLLEDSFALGHRGSGGLLHSRYSHAQLHVNRFKSQRDALKTTHEALIAEGEAGNPSVLKQLEQRITEIQQKNLNPALGRLARLKAEADYEIFLLASKDNQQKTLAMTAEAMRVFDPTKSREAMIEELAKTLHNSHRKAYFFPSDELKGSYVWQKKLELAQIPSGEFTKEQSVILEAIAKIENGELRFLPSARPLDRARPDGEWFNLSATNFEDLPEFWKNENLRTAEKFYERFSEYMAREGAGAEIFSSDKIGEIHSFFKDIQRYRQPGWNRIFEELLGISEEGRANIVISKIEVENYLKRKNLPSKEDLWLMLSSEEHHAWLDRTGYYLESVGIGIGGQAYQAHDEEKPHPRPEPEKSQ